MVERACHRDQTSLPRAQPRPSTPPPAAPGAAGLDLLHAADDGDRRGRRPAPRRRAPHRSPSVTTLRNLTLGETLGESCGLASGLEDPETPCDRSEGGPWPTHPDPRCKASAAVTPHPPAAPCGIMRLSPHMPRGARRYGGMALRMWEEGRAVRCRSEGIAMGAMWTVPHSHKYWPCGRTQSFSTGSETLGDTLSPSRVDTKIYIMLGLPKSSRADGFTHEHT